MAPKYPFYTPYQFAGNMPIWAVDLDGLEPDFRGSDGQYAVAALAGTEDYYGWTWQDGNWAQGTSTSYSFREVDISKEQSIANTGAEDLTTHAYVGKESQNITRRGQKFESNFGRNFKTQKRLENQAIRRLKRGFKGGTLFRMTNDEDVLLGHFFKGDGSPISFGFSSGMTDAITGFAPFQDYAASFELKAMNWFKEHGTLEGFNGDDVISRTRPELFWKKS